MKLWGAKAAVAAAAVAALFTAGCAAQGSDTAAGPAGEERVAALGIGDADTLLALGIKPVTTAPWGTPGTTDPTGVGPWAKDLLGDATPVPIFNTAQGFSSESLEKIAATAPTTIVAVNQVVTPDAQAELEKIAPTTVRPDGYADWQIPWDVQVTTISDAVDKHEEGEELIEKTTAAFDDFRASHPELQGKKAAAIMPYEGKVALVTSGDGRGQFLEDLGFVIPKDLQGDDGNFFRDYSPENYSEFEDLDLLFVLDYNGTAEALKEDQGFQELKIATDGRVRYLDTDTANAMSMPNPVTIPWILDKFDDAVGPRS